MQWPNDLPRKEIVLPRLLNEPTTGIATPTLWAMLDEQEIQQREHQTIFQHFLFAPQPHPVVLWVNGLFKEGMPVRWLRTYLDLKQPGDHEIFRCLLSEQSYRLIFFGLRSGECVHTVHQRIDFRQRELMKLWQRYALQSRGNSLSLSKQALSLQFEQLKPSVLKEMKTQVKLPVVNTSETFQAVYS
jgi:hypothetical protein